MMTRLVKTLFFIGIALLITGLVAPSFINWNKHKSALMAQISPYFQRKISVDGNISFQILPQPELQLANVTVANADGSMKNPLMKLKSLDVQVDLMPLLQGQIVVNTVNLMQPVFNVEVYNNGKTNLSGFFSPSDDDLVTTAKATQLNQISVTDGTLHYTNVLTGTHKTFDNLTLTVSADTLLGPYHVTGTMEYQQTNANIEIDTGVFDQTMTAPIELSFMPVEKMPQITLKGTISLHGGINLGGKLSLSNGSLSSLADIPELNALDFWETDVSMTGAMTLKGDRFTLKDIDARFGQDSHLRGTVSVKVPHRGIRDVQANLSADDLTVTGQYANAYLAIPDGYKINLRLKGKNILWDGKKLATADISAFTENKNWQIRSAQVTLAGHSDITFSGTVMPDADSAVYTHLHITTDDLGKMVDAFAPASTNSFSILGGENAPFKKMQMSSSLQISPDKISFYDIDATLGKTGKISGVLNVARTTKQPNFTAMLHLDGWDSAEFPEAFQKFLMGSQATLQLTADNFTTNGLSLTGITFDATTGANGLKIRKFDGDLSGSDDTFSMTGRVANLAPASGVDITYALKAADAPKIAKSLGAALPPLTGRNFSLKGTVMQTPEGDYSYTAAGQADALTLQGQTIGHASFALNAPKPLTVSILNLTGELWSGALKGRLDFTAGANPEIWAATFKGSVKKAHLPALQEQLGLKGFAIGSGDIDFDLSTADNTLQSANGDISLQADKLTVDDFNATRLPERLHKLKKMPADLATLVSDAVHHDGASVFKNVQGKFKIDHGKISITSLTADNTTARMSLTGTASIALRSYALSGSLQLLKQKDFPALTITRSSKDPDYAVSDGKALQTYVGKHLPPPPTLKKREKHVLLLKKEDHPISDILDRLNAPGIAAEKPAAQSPPS